MHLLRFHAGRWAARPSNATDIGVTLKATAKASSDAVRRFLLDARMASR